MFIYRPHRGGLQESIAESKEFETEEEMKDFIFNYHKEYFFSLGYKQPPFDIDDIVINKERKANDERCGWHDTMYVCVKRYGNKNYIEKYGCPQCIGMCATDYER
jgi:hypothetical protein